MERRETFERRNDFKGKVVPKPHSSECWHVGKPAGCTNPKCTSKHPPGWNATTNSKGNDLAEKSNQKPKGTLNCRFVGQPTGCKNPVCKFNHPRDWNAATNPKAEKEPKDGKSNQKSGHLSIKSKMNPSTDSVSWTSKPHSESVRSSSHFHPLSVEVRRFLDLIHERVCVHNDRRLSPIHVDNERDQCMWRQCWAVAGSEVIAWKHISCLPLALLLIPANTILSSELIVEVMARATAAAGNVTTGEAATSLSPIVVLEGVVNVFRYRLLDMISKIDDCSKIEITLNHIKVAFHRSVSLLTPKYPDHFENLGRLMMAQNIFNEYAKAVSKQAPKERGMQQGIDGTAENESPWLGWTKRATLGWLMSSSWHNVPDLGNVYASSDQYADTLLRVWTLLTFYWGAGAVWPKCSHRQGGDTEGICGQPLLAAVHGGRLPCCSKLANGGQCPNQPSWRCSRHGHDSMCRSCVHQHQNRLIGAPCRGSSTDIYDAIVDGEVTRRDGAIHLVSSLTSRKPPTVPPNWRTTYRLQASALVAVARLGGSSEPLRRDQRLQWAEIVPIDPRRGTDGDWEMRKHGRMALRLLSRGDCPSLPQDADMALDRGTRIAIIDLRVFVPEVVSVLSTFARDSFKTHLATIPFIANLIGAKTSTVSLPSSIRFFGDEAASPQAVITAAIHRSEIECVVALSPLLREGLARDICALQQVKSLYGTQLQAFAEALAWSVHCTQGPPGTGKSFVGVALVLALVLIRKAATKAGQAVGPVVMLSYKNHALDEFLADVLHFALPTLQVGELIRSGKPENQDLLHFREKGSSFEKQADEVLMKRIGVCRRADRVVREWRDLADFFETKASCQTSAQSIDSTAVTLAWEPMERSEVRCTAETDNILSALTLCNKLTETKGKKVMQCLSCRKADPKFNCLICSSPYCDHNCQLSHLLHHENMCLFISRGGGTPVHLDDIEQSSEAFELIATDLTIGTVINPARAVERVKMLMPPFFEAAEHWKSGVAGGDEFAQLCFWLNAWLCGLQPPPRCRARIDMDVQDSAQCMGTACDPSPFCEARHKCLASRTCANPRNPRGIVHCNAHRCLFVSAEPGPLCSHKRFEDSEFCADHSCNGCFQQQMVNPTHRIAPKVGKHACEAHQCIEARVGRGPGDHCDNLRIAPHLFCPHHCCKVCLDRGVVSNEALTSLASKFCAEHECSFRTCTRPRRLDFDHCLDHTCAMCLQESVLQSVDIACPESKLCADHRCSHPDYLCDHPRDAMSHFCIAHTCRVCKVLGMESTSPVTDEAPRNACEVHVLCCYVFERTGGLCHALACPDSTFCEKHGKRAHLNKSSSATIKRIAGDGQCCGINKKKKRCGAKGVSADGGQFYCNAHADQAQEGAEDADGDEEEEEEEDDEVLIAAALSLTGFRHVPEVQCHGIDQITNTRCSVVTTGAIALSSESWFCIAHSRHMVVEAKKMEADPSMVAVESRTCKGPEDAADSKQSECESSQLPLRSDISASFDEGTGENDKEEVDIEIAVFDCDDAGPGDIHPDELWMDDGDALVDDGDGIGDEGDAGNVDQQRLREIGDNDNDGDGGDEGDDMDLVDALRIGAGSNSKQGPGSDKHFQATQDQGVNQHIYDNVTALQEVIQWNWSSPVRERWLSVARLLRGMSVTVATLRARSDGHVTEARRQRAEAGAQAFRAAKVIGATVVGAARRLEAIRAAEPFAVVVEEACEVMEPTLIAVLAVKSLRKLELVGDHRQLPAFVQNCWFNLEGSLPSIKTSLFERLVEGESPSDGRPRKKLTATEKGSGSGASSSCVPFTVLDEQRRMRASIADITRPDYSDIITITDHPQTQLQQIGDKVSDRHQKKSLALHKEVWANANAASPQPIPGIPANIFFWNISGNREGRPLAGLSACNPVEAAAVSALTKWLLVCGVPSSSISIITPYKGQKNAIIAALRKNKCLPSFNPAAPPATGSTVTVSTVDRYQGDENDIVILSLVRTQPGNRFVGLLNRFIVAVSRARLGFYVVGSVDAVVKNRQNQDGPAHWIRFVAQLAAGHEDNMSTMNSIVPPSALPSIGSPLVFESGPAAEESDSSSPMLRSRVGLMADSVVSLVGSVMSSVVGSIAGSVMGSMVEGGNLEGGKDQNPRVGAKLKVCCPRHGDRSRAEISKPEDFPQPTSWNNFCNLVCGHLLVCGHGCSLECHSPVQVPHKQQCEQVVARPCTLHEDVPLICFQVRSNETSWETAWARFKCDIPVEYSRPECDHKERLPCHQYHGVVEGSAHLGDCIESVPNFVQPACNHVIKKMRCAQRRQFEAKPPKCTEEVEFQRKCGCSSRMKCWEVAREALAPSACLRAVDTKRPRCGHKLSLRCFRATALHEQWDASDAESVRSEVAGQALVEHGVSYGVSESNMMDEIPDCRVLVSYRGPCGHIFVNLPCDLAFQFASGAAPSPQCGTSVDVASPLCTHVVKMPCWAANDLGSCSWDPWRLTSAPSIDPAGVVGVLEQSLLVKAEEAPLALTRILRKACNRFVRVSRSCGAGHDEMVPCSQLLKLLLQKTTMKLCGHKVRRELPCSHATDVECHARSSDPPPFCQVAVGDEYVFPCGVHSVPAGTCGRLRALRAQSSEEARCLALVDRFRSRCGHEISIRCWEQDKATSISQGHQLAQFPGRAGTGGSRGDVLGQLIVDEGELYCEIEEGLEPCQALVSFCHRECGHVCANIACSTAFLWASGAIPAPKCDELVHIDHPVCLHSVAVPCYIASRALQWRPWGESSSTLAEVVDGIDECGDPVIRSMVRFSDALPVAPPMRISPQALDCGESVVFERACGHSSRVRCSDAHRRTLRDCVEMVTTSCKSCGYESQTKCVAWTTQRDTGILRPCDNWVEKLCSLCKVTNMKALCGKEDHVCNRNITITLRCGHATTWRCGKDRDPRKEMADVEVVCRACCLDAWTHALKAQTQPDEVAQLEIGLRSSVRNMLRGCEVVEQLDMPLEKSFAKFEEGRSKLLEQCWERMKDPRAPALPPPQPLGSHGDLERYRFIFTPLDSGGKGAARMPPKGKGAVAAGNSSVEQMMKKATMKLTKMEDSPYGFGAKVTQMMSSDDLSDVKPDEDGMVSVCVGAVYAMRTLEDTPPFASGNNKKNVQKRNQVAKNFQKNGFDNVAVKGTGSSKQFVHWMGGTVMPVCVAKLKLHVRCSICGDNFTHAQGFFCSNRHFICWDTCFDMYVASAQEPGAIGRSVDSEGNLKCPECTEAYTLQAVASTGPPRVFEALVTLKLKTNEKSAVVKAVQDNEKRLRAEFEQIQQIADIDLRSATILRMEIIDKILVLKCPRCKAAFVDFTGCCALTCANLSCRCGFCAWCLADCGSDAHGHVPRCPLNPNRLFAPQVEWEAFQRDRKKRLVVERIGREDAQVQRHVRRLLEKDLRDLGIDLGAELQGAARAPQQQQQQQQQAGGGHGGGLQGLFRNFVGL